MASKPKAAKARVLTHIHGQGADNGDLLVAPESVIKALADSGLVDPHADAVGYAEANDARVVEYVAPVAEEPAADVA